MSIYYYLELKTMYISFSFSVIVPGNAQNCKITQSLEEDGHILLSKIIPCDYVKGRTTNIYMRQIYARL